MTTTMDPVAPVDPIDLVIPRPRPWWVRFAAAVAVLVAVGAVAMLWGYGYLYPQPETFGSGSGSALMGLTADGTAVVITFHVFNSSGRDLEITSATANLPGAEVRSIGALDDARFFDVRAPSPLPVVIDGHDWTRLAIVFVPTTCVDPGGAWGSVRAHLSVVHQSIPSFDRTMTLPNAVFDATSGQIGFGPDDAEKQLPTTPLAAACALLGRSG